jgi:hypothetical protein
MRKFWASLLSATLLVSAGCTGVRNHEVAEINALPDVSRYQNKPSACVDFQVFRGQPDQADVQVVAPARTALLPLMTKTLNDSGLFSRVAFDAAAGNACDYLVALRLYMHGNIVASFVSGFITGATFFVIPGAGTDNYTMNVDVVPAAGGAAQHYRNKDSVTTWFGLWFIPMAGHTTQQAAADTLANQLKDALSKLVRDGALQYSLLDGGAGLVLPG